MNKTVSVIIPNFNKAKYLKECIESVLEQTYPFVTIIIVDDHSTDNSLEIINHYQQKHNNIKVIALQENGGVCHARNIGVENCDTDYIVFLDSDDIYVNKDKLKNEMELVDTYKIAFSQYVEMEEDGTLRQHRPIRHNKYASKYAVVDLLLITRRVREYMRGYVVSRQLFNEIGGYDTSFNIYEDLDYQCRLAMKAKFVYTKAVGEGYRLNTGGLSKTKSHQGRTAIKQVRIKYYAQLTTMGKLYYYYRVVYKWLRFQCDRARRLIGRMYDFTKNK